jgi:hypothetical protein
MAKNNTEPLKPIIVTIGSGGTGKSTISRLVYDFAGLDERTEVPVFDCDMDGNRDLHKISPHRIHVMSLGNSEFIHQLVSVANSESPVLVDLPSSCLERFAESLTPEMVKELKNTVGVRWLPVYMITARNSSIPVLRAWREQVWGDTPAIIVVSQKDGLVRQEVVEEVRYQNDIIIRLPKLEVELAAFADAAACTWKNLLDGNAILDNPLRIMQLKRVRDEFEKELRPLIAHFK